MKIKITIDDIPLFDPASDNDNDDLEKSLAYEILAEEAAEHGMNVQEYLESEDDDDEDDYKENDYKENDYKENDYKENDYEEEKDGYDEDDDDEDEDDEDGIENLQEEDCPKGEDDHDGDNPTGQDVDKGKEDKDADGDNGDGKKPERSSSWASLVPSRMLGGRPVTSEPGPTPQPNITFEQIRNAKPMPDFRPGAHRF